MKRKILKNIAAASIALALSGQAFAKGEVIVFSSPNMAMPFEVNLQRRAVAMAKKLDVELLVLDGQGSSPKQVADLENSIVRGAQGFILAPNDVNAVTSAVDEILEEGIPIVTLDRKVQGAIKPVPHFGADNFKGGEVLAQFVIDNYPKGANIVLLTGQPGSSSNIERVNGIRTKLKSAGSSYKLVVDQTGNWMRSEGMRIVESAVPALAEKPDVILSANDDMALGAMEALHTLGFKSGEVKVVGFDAVPEALLRIEDGTMAASADQRPGFAVEEAMRQLVNKIRKGDKVKGANFRPVLITNANIADAERINEAHGK